MTAKLKASALLAPHPAFGLWLSVVRRRTLASGPYCGYRQNCWNAHEKYGYAALTPFHANQANARAPFTPLSRARAQSFFCRTGPTVSTAADVPFVACSRVSSESDMKTLYELLGALPHDDAEALRSAFRKAVKGAHPDLRPGDADAALKFRQIVRANQILCDAEEREAYDHLLELAHLEQVSASKKAAAAKVHRLASGVIALTGASVVTVSGYLLFIHLSAASIASISNVSASMRSWPELAPLAAGSADLQKSAPELGQNASISDARGAQNSDLTEAETENVFHVQFGGSPEFPGSEARA